MQEKQIIKFIKGELNVDERQKAIKWIRSSSENQAKFNLLKATHIGATFKQTSGDNSAIYYKRFSRKVKSKQGYKYISAIASLIVISVFLINYFYQPVEKTEITEIPATDIIEKNIINNVTSKGVKSEVILPDGSKVVLNADSKLTYPKKFSDSTRNVTLIGEAFFDIEHNSNRPFIVDANEIKIKVLGTTFNVKSYSKDEKIETTLVSGKVELIKHSDTTPIELAPSQKGIFYKSQNKLKIEEVNSSNIIAWKEGTLIFKNTSMSQVAIDLERKYNVKFIINSQKLLNYEYTGTFDNLTINEVLKLLVISSPIKYVIKDEKVILEMN